MPLHLGAFALSNSKRVLNNFIPAIGGFYSNDVYYTDTDSLYIKNKHWEKLDKAGLVGKNRLQGKMIIKKEALGMVFLSAKIKILFNCN